MLDNINIIPLQQDLPPGVAVFDTNQTFGSHEEWLRFMKIFYDSGILGKALQGPDPIFDNMPELLSCVEGRSYELSRDQEVNGKLTYRDPWANDFFWHTDGASWVGDEPPFLTGIYCKLAGDATPGFEILDSSCLYDDLRAEFGEEVLGAIGLEYRLSTTYRDFQPNLLRSGVFGRAMIERMCRQHNIKYSDSLDLGILIAAMAEYADEVDGVNNSFVRTIPMICRNPVSGRWGIHMDMGQRTVVSKLVLEHIEVLRVARRILVQGEIPIDRIDIKPGRMIFFVREGTLHRAMPGNDRPRHLYIGHLATVNSS